MTRLALRSAVVRLGNPQLQRAGTGLPVRFSDIEQVLAALIQYQYQV
jgi:hypothetical protein